MELEYLLSMAKQRLLSIHIEVSASCLPINVRRGLSVCLQRSTSQPYTVKASGDYHGPNAVSKLIAFYVRGVVTME